MMCMHNQMTKMTNTAQKMKVQAKMKKMIVMMTEMIMRTQIKLERKPYQY